MIGSWSNRIIDESRCHARDRHTFDTSNSDVNYVTLGLALACMACAPRMWPPYSPSAALRKTILSFHRCMTAAEPGQPEPTPTPPTRGRIATLLPGVASAAALITAIVTLVSVSATENQVQIARQGQATAEQGQFTDRYNAASTNLGSRSIDIRLGGIYAPQRLMQDSPRDQPTIIAVLCAFVRDRTMPTRKPQKPPTIRPPTDIQAALTVVGTRKTANDGHATVDDLDLTQLAGAQLVHGNLSRADLNHADLTDAFLTLADLTRANLRGANLTGAQLSGAQLSGANLIGANFTYAKPAVSRPTASPCSPRRPPTAVR